MSDREIDGNVAARLRIVASLMPGAIAIAEPDGAAGADGSRSYALTTFQSLNDGSEAIARGLVAWGIRPNMRLVMLVPFGASFIKLAFALLKAGVTLVLIDPGMSRKHLIQCLSETEPDGFVGIPKAQAIRTVSARQVSVGALERDGWPPLFLGRQNASTNRSPGQESVT